MTPTLPRSEGLAATLAASVAALLAATAPAASADAQRPIGPRLQTVLDRAVASPRTTFPGVALRVRAPGRGVWAGAAGKARIDPARPMRPHHRFRAGSIAKTFVAAAALQLAEEGRLALDDPLPAVLPARVTARFPDADRITVRMLLNHTSGIAEYSDAAHEQEILANPRRRWKVAELLDRAAARPRTGAPGERHAYSNANYNLLGLVLERATGTSWRTVVRERILEPLDLRRSSLPDPGDVVRAPDIAHGYELLGCRLRDVAHVDASMAGAAGGNAMLTSTGDLSRFLRALLGGRLFRRPESLEAMRTFVPAPGDHGEVGYGLGLQRFILPGGVEVVGHMGTAAGYRAYMFHLPAHDIDVSMVTTTPDDPMPVLGPALDLVLADAS